MRKPTRYAQNRSSSTGIKPEKSNLDIWFQRSVWTVQLLLFPLAIVGYIFTVRPVYQKQLLDEKIAERSVLLQNATINVEKLSQDQSRLIKENKALASDAEKTYSSLKANVLNSLPTLGTSCAYTSQTTGDALFTCINKAVNKEVAEVLRPADRSLLQSAMTNHRSEIIAIADDLDKKQKEAEAKKARNIKRLDLVVNAYPRDAIVKIHKLRGAIGPVPKTVEELGELRNNDEVNVHNKILDASKTALMDVTLARIDGVSFGGPGYQISTKLGEIMRRVRDEAAK